MNLEHGLLAFVLVIAVMADVYVISEIAGSAVALVEKLAWTFLILQLPLFGFAVWWLGGPRVGENRPTPQGLLEAADDVTD